MPCVDVFTRGNAPTTQHIRSFHEQAGAHGLILMQYGGAQAIALCAVVHGCMAYRQARAGVDVVGPVPASNQLVTDLLGPLRELHGGIWQLIERLIRTVHQLESVTSRKDGMRRGQCFLIFLA